MSINLKVYRKIGYEDVYPGMDLRIIINGPKVKSDVEGEVNSMFRGGPRSYGNTSFVLADYDRVTFKHDPSTSYIAGLHGYSKSTTIELYEVIDALPDEPKGVGAVVRVVDRTRPGRTMEAVKTGRNTSRAWVGKVAVMSWEEIMSCVLSRGYDYIQVLSKGVEL